MQQLGAELVELLLPEQQVLADLVVKQLDRLDRQVEPLVLAVAGRGELLITPGDFVLGGNELGVGDI